MSKTETKAPAAKANQGGQNPAGSKPEKARFLSVRSLRNGFRRGGRAWGETEVVVAAAEFTDEQLAQIEAEPLLVVREAAGPAATDA